MLLFLAAMMATGLLAQNSDKAVLHGSTYYIKGPLLYNGTSTMSQTNVIIKDGIIKDIGAALPVPFDAQIIEADSMYLYPGFVAAAAHLGLAEAKKEDEEKVADPGNPPPHRAGITPQILASSQISLSAKDLGEYRKHGFTLSHTLPKGRMLPGQGAIILLGDGDKPEDLVLRDQTALFAQLRSARGVYPATVIGVMSKWRELFRNAELTKTYGDKYAMQPAGMAKPVKNNEVEALVPAATRKQPVFFKAKDVLDIYRVLQLQRDSKFDLVLCGTKQANLALDKIKALRRPVLLSLDLPKEAKLDTAKEYDDETKAFMDRKVASYQKHLAQAAEMEKAGVQFAFSYLDIKTKDVLPNIKKMIDAGLSEKAAIDALTMSPARIIGMDQVAGSITRGKMANMILADKALFEDKVHMHYVFVNGKPHHYEKKAPKKAKDGDVKEGLAGTWKYEVEIMGQTERGEMAFEEVDGNWSVTVSSDGDNPESTDKVSVDGNSVSFPMKVTDSGMTMDITISFTMDGTSYEGTVDIAGMGSFPITGVKMPD